MSLLTLRITAIYLALVGMLAQACTNTVVLRPQSTTELHISRIGLMAEYTGSRERNPQRPLLQVIGGLFATRFIF